MLSSAPLEEIMASVVSLPPEDRRRALSLVFELASIMARSAIGVDHDLRLYERVVSSFVPAHMKSGLEGLFTIRFITIYLDELGIEVLRCDKEVKRIVKSTLRSFCRRFEEVQKVREKVNLMKELFVSLRDVGFLRASEEGLRSLTRVACEEFLHGLMLDGTSLHKLVDVVSWEERFLSIYMLEVVHRALPETLFPRSPEIAWSNGLSDDEIERILRESRRILEEYESVKKRLTEAFKELYARMFFKSIFYPSVVLPLVEAPTWELLVKLGLMERDDVEDRMIDYFAGEDEISQRQFGMAKRVSELIKELDVEEIVSAVRNCLNIPLEDLKRVLTGGEVGKEVIRLSDLLFERLENVLKGLRVDVEVHAISMKSLLTSLGIFRMRDLTEVFSEILSEEPEMMRCVALYSARPRKLGIILSSSKCTVLYDPWTMEESDEIYGGVVVKRTGRKLTTTEDLVGSTPLVFKGYLMLRHYLTITGGIEHLIAKVQRILGVDEKTWKDYVNGLERFSFVEMIDRDSVLNISPFHAIDAILGVIYTFAKLGERATRLGGFHGIYIT
jgi:hypothetical protein